MVTGPSRQIVTYTLQLHPGVGPLDLQESGDLVYAEIFVGTLRPMSAPTSVPSAMSQEQPLGTLRIPTYTSCVGELHTRG